MKNCPLCDGTMKSGNLQSPGEGNSRIFFVFKLDKWENMNEHETYQVRAKICTDCGHIALNADLSKNND